MISKPSFKSQLVFAISAESFGFVISIVTSILLARLLSLQDRGVLASLNALILVFSITSSFSASSVELQAKHLVSRFKHLLFILFRDTLVLSCLCLPLIAIFLNIIGLSTYVDSRIYLLISINFSANCAYLILQKIASGVGLINQVYSSSLRSVILYGVSIILLSLSGKFSLFSAFLLSTILQIAVFLFLLASLYKKKQEGYLFTEWQTNLKPIGIKKRLNAFFQDLLSTLTERTLPLIVVALFGADTAAIFRIASTISDLSQKLPRIFTQIQRSSILSRSSGWHRVFKLTQIFTVLSTLSCIVLHFFGADLISFAFSANYRSADFPALLLCVANLPWTIYILFSNQINLKSRYPVVMLLPSFVPVFTLSSLWLLHTLNIRVLSSLNQLIICFIASYTVMAFIAVLISLRTTRLKLYFLFPWFSRTSKV